MMDNTTRAIGTTRERRAYICTHSAHSVPLRVFLAPGEPEPRCAEHGPMTPQANMPYKRPRQVEVRRKTKAKGKR